MPKIPLDIVNILARISGFCGFPAIAVSFAPFKGCAKSTAIAGKLSGSQKASRRLIRRFPYTPPAKTTSLIQTILEHLEVSF